jgi:hypothetical protein
MSKSSFISRESPEFRINIKRLFYHDFTTVTAWA